jgi:6,7-dimethyl-8-ribityllumazine synthase
MYLPHIVIIEARNQAKLADLLYQSVAQVLEVKGIGFSRVTIPTALELPTALRIIIEATKGSGENHSTDWRRPDGYVILGSFIQTDMPCNQIAYGEVLRALQDLSCYYALPAGFGMVVAENLEAAFNYAEIGRHAAQTCLSLIELKSQFGLPPSAILAP